MAEKHWEAVDGLQLRREMQLSIAGQAGLLCLGFPDFYFDRMATIIIREKPYVVRESKVPLGTGGHVLVAPTRREGEAWRDGPVVVSWSEALVGGQCWNEGNNLVMHEFTHQLDTSFDRIADGNPGLFGLEKRRWNDVFAEAEERLREANRSNRYSVLDPYGLTNRAELFSVSVEAFFQHGDWLQKDEGDLYELLRDFFKLETAQWGPAPGRSMD